MEKHKMDLYENYFNSAKKYLTEAEDEDLELTDVPTEDDANLDDIPEEGDVEEGGDEEVLELDLSNPVCPSCGATLIPVGEIDTTEEDEDGNPIYDEDEADAIELLQGLGYVIYKPAADVDADEEGVDDDFPGEDDEDFGDEDELPEDED